MTEQQIKEYVAVQFPKENESCEWKEYKNLQNTLCGHDGDDVVSYVSALSNVQNLLSALRMAGRIEYKGGFWQLKN